FVMDTQTDPPTSVAVIRRAINERPFAILGTVYSSSTVPNMEIARQAGIRQISGSEPVLVVRTGTPNIFLTSVRQQLGLAKLGRDPDDDLQPRGGERATDDPAAQDGTRRRARRRQPVRPDHHQRRRGSDERRSLPRSHDRALSGAEHGGDGPALRAAVRPGVRPAAAGP